MAQIVSSPSRRGVSLTLGGLFVAASALMASYPIATATPSTEAVNAIDSRYAAFGGEGSLLGAPVGEAVDVPGGAEREYQGGAIYYSKDTGAHVMYGAILDRYQALGGPDGSTLGFPKNDEADTGDGTGRFNDFSTPEGASLYWTPQWGASVIKGRVLEAWRQSGGITGPFGYPSTDTSIADGVQTGKFVGPDGTEIQWSQAAGLVTVPADLAATIPGFGTTAPTAEGTTSVTTSSLPASPAPQRSAKSSKWWWIPVGIAVLALLGGLLRLLRRRPTAPAPVKVAAQRAPEAPKPVPPVPPAPSAPPLAKTPPPAPPVRPVAPPVSPLVPPPVAPPVSPPVSKAPPLPPPAPKPPAPPTPPPAKVVPLVPPAARAPQPPAARPVPPPAPPAPPVRPLLSEPPKATIHTEATESDVSPVIKYASHSPAETTIKITYENNAVGDNQESVADKSDSVTD